MGQKPVKVFISHSSKDIDFVKPLVDLLDHIGLTTENMFCSSVPGYGIPLGNNIYNYLKDQFQYYDLRVIFVLSENYYESSASLIEMGAAWVLQHQYTSILIPPFDFEDIKGAVDRMQISIKLDSDLSELKGRLNELRETIISEFDLRSSSQSIWESHRDEFISKVNSEKVYWNIIHQLRDKKIPIKEWISPLQKLIEINSESYDAMYILGSIYAELQDKEKASKYLKMTVALSKNKDIKDQAIRRLEKLE